MLLDNNNEPTGNSSNTQTSRMLEIKMNGLNEIAIAGEMKTSTERSVYSKM